MALLLSPAPAPAIIQPYFDGYYGVVERMALSFGQAGRDLARIADAAMNQANNRSEPLVGAVGEAAFSYENVPLKKAFTTTVRYKIRGAMKPMRFSSDE